MFKLMKRYMREYKWYAIFSPIMMILEVMADVAAPYIMSIIVDQAIPAQNQTLAIRFGFIMIGIAIWGLICGAVSSYLGSTAGNGLGANVRKDLFSKVQELSFAQLDSFQIPSLITRLTNDIQTVSMVGMMSLRMAIRAPFMMIFAVFMAFRIDRGLAGIFAVVLPLLAVLIVIILLLAKPRFKAWQTQTDRVNQTIEEDLTSVRVIKSFVREDYEKRRFAQENDRLRDISLNAMNLVIIFLPIMNLIVYGTIIAIFWLGSGPVMSGRLGAGQMMSLVTYCTQILMALMMLSMYFLQLTRGNASADRIMEVLNTESDLTSPEEDPVMTVPDGRISFENVYFRYDQSSRDTLMDVNLEIHDGETLGIIGSTGSAKTSLVQLIPRLYDVTAGQVKVGGIPVENYDLSVLRDAVAFVLQKNTLFSGTVRENMQWGKADADDEEIIKALQHAQAWEFISKMDRGLDTWVEQGGSNFSGGQRQRLAIARALLKSPKILILDDSTSAVDADTDAKLRQSFAENLQGVTTLIIAQRIQSIQNADRILVMEEGRVQALGTHEELLQNNEIYQELYETQIKGALQA